MENEECGVWKMRGMENAEYDFFFEVHSSETTVFLFTPANKHRISELAVNI